MGSMVGAMQPSLREFGNQMNQYAFNQQLGRGVSNQMYQPPRSDYDPYTASRRPNYMPYGPNQQFYQPIYRPSYGPGPFGGFYQQPQQNMFGPATDISNQGQAALRQMPQQQDMFRPAADIFGPSGERTSVLSEGGFSGPMLSPQPTQQQYTPAPTQQANPVVRRIFKGNFSRAFGGQQPSNFPYSVNYGAPMLSPQPMQSQYRPIPFASQTTIDQLVSQARSEGMSEGQAAAQSAFANSGGGAKAGGKVHEEGIDSLLKK